MSQIRPPSRIPATPGRGLFEMSASDNNVRASSMMPPPGTIAQKHKPSGRACYPGQCIQQSVDPLTVPEPAPKRKTLVERAGEAPRGNQAAPPSSKPVNGAVKATALAGVRNTSLSSSASSRVPSTGSRNTSSNSFISNISESRRPPSVLGYHRPQTVLGHTRSTSQNPASAARPATSMDNPFTTSEQPVLGKRKGTVPISISTFQPGDNPQLRKQRERHFKQQTYTSSWNSSASVQPQATVLSQSQVPAQEPLRNFSFLSTAFGNLNLGSETHKPEGRKSNTEEEPNVPGTPSYIPRLTPKPPQPPPSPAPSVVNTPSRLHSRPASPRKVFLSKESNSPVLVWDTKGKLEDLECLYTNLKAQMEGTTFEKNSMKEIVELYKQRSMSPPAC